QAVLVALLGPAHDAQEPDAGLVLRRGRLVELDSGPVGEYLPGLLEADLLHLLDEGDDVAELAAGPAPVALAAGVDVERRPAVGVEGAEGLEGAGGGGEREIPAHDTHDVAGGLDLPGQLHRVRRHRAPFQSAKFTTRSPDRGTRSSRSGLRTLPL